MTTAQHLVEPFDLGIEKPRALSRHHDLGILRLAIKADSKAIAVRERLATQLFILDEFDEAIAIFESLAIDAPRFMTLRLLAECYLSRETTQDDGRAADTSLRALSFADTPEKKGAALATLAKAQKRQHQPELARQNLLQALQFSPSDSNAYKRLAALDLDAHAHEAILETADALIEQGVGHSRLLVARALALAKMGKVEEARVAIGLEQFLLNDMLAPPPGWASVDAFNAALASELLAHPDIRYDRYGTASAHTWRIDEPVTDGSRFMPQLQASIRHAVLDHVVAIEAVNHPWIRLRPSAALLHNWCVMTDADGYEEWHVHQNGWMSGVYYVDVPPMVRNGHDRAGCIAFGMPDDLVGADAASAYGEKIVRPLPGKLMLFPSHAYHRTYAHGGSHRRICVAFDILPN